MEEDSPYDIRICRESECLDVDAERMREAVVRTLRRNNCHRAHISIALVDDEQIAELNERHLHHKGPTDVLAFDLADDGAANIEAELVISLETAAREAAGRGHDPTAEVLLYAVHGTLHLTGMNDATDQGAHRMHEVEDQVLGEMGIGPIFAGSAS